MKIHALLLPLSLAVLVGCSPTSDQAQVSVPSTIAAKPEMGPSTAEVASQASASGEVTAVDASASTVTIQHGPVAELDWPAMTMTFQAPDVDLDEVAVGDRVSFDFTSSGMNATITALTQTEDD